MPYYAWFVIAAILFGLEMFSGTFYLLVLAVAALGGGVAAYAGGQALLQFGVVAVLALAGFLLAQRHRPAKGAGLSDMNAGNSVEWLGAMPNGLWRVRYRGTEWQARPASPDTNPNAPLIIQATEGNILVVKN